MCLSNAFHRSPYLALALLIAAQLQAAPARAGLTERLSVSQTGEQGSDRSIEPAISPDGRFLAFASGANDLVPNDTNPDYDIFFRDRCVANGVAVPGCTPTVSLESVRSDGVQGSRSSVHPVMSADGRFVAFSSIAPNLVSNDVNGTSDVFVRDRCLSHGSPVPGCSTATTLVTTNLSGTPGSGCSVRQGVSSCGSWDPAMSPDGRFIAFRSFSPDLVAVDGNLSGDVFVRDRCLAGGVAVPDCTPTTAIVSVTPAGAPANDHSGWPSISDDGRFVAFVSNGDDVVSDDDNGVRDAFVRDRCVSHGSPVADCMPYTELVSAAADGTVANGVSEYTSMSGDGRFVAFTSLASDIAGPKTKGWLDVFVRDRCRSSSGEIPGCTPRTSLESVNARGAVGNRESFIPVLSSNGRYLLFSSGASNLVLGDVSQTYDVFVRDRCLADGDAVPNCVPKNALVSVSSADEQDDAVSGTNVQGLTADGREVVFGSEARLVPDDTNDASDVFVRRSECGDAVIDHAEQCDDGNVADDDGCSSSCASETPPPSIGDPARCTAAIVRASADYARARMRILGKCEERVATGQLPGATICADHESTQAGIARAEAGMRDLIARTCGGLDGRCGTLDDASVAAIGWDVGACPSAASGHPECTTSEAIADCADVGDCVKCGVAAVTDPLIGLYYDALNTGASSTRCQGAIGRAAIKFADAKLKVLARCERDVLRAKIAGPCPDANVAAPRIAKAERKKIAAICKTCGGLDGGCDQDVVGPSGTTVGTGGADDLTPATIGFPGECPAVSIPDGMACQAPIDGLGALVGCVACATEAGVDCVDAFAVPMLKSHPAVCDAVY